MDHRGAHASDSSLRILVKLVAAEKNPHDLISRISAEASLLEHARSVFSRHASGLLHHEQILGACEAYLVQPDFFLERLRLIGYALHMANPEEDYYALLHVDRKSSREEIKRAFRRMSLQLHPDANPNDPQSADRFMRIRKAYEILSDPVLRRHYDMHSASPSWIEDDVAQKEASSSSGNRRLVCEIAIMAVLLLILSFFLDYQQVFTNAYNRAFQDEPAPTQMNLPDEVAMKRRAEEERIKKAETQKGKAENQTRQLVMKPRSKESALKNDPAVVEEEVTAFLNRYVGAYQSKDVAGLLELFSPNALVNGAPIDKVAHLYRDSFRRADRIQCNIEVVKWSIAGSTAEVSGLLRLSMRLAGDSPLESNGPIKFHLIRKGDSLRIERVDYLRE